MEDKFKAIAIDVLAKVLYEVLNHGVSIDVAFKKVCKGRCVPSLEEREKLYSMVRSFISDYFKLKCVIGKRKVTYRKLARLWINGISEVPKEPYCLLSYSRWFYDKVVSILGKDEGEEVLRAMNERIWWLRINTLRIDIDKAYKELEKEGVDYVVDNNYPYMVRIVNAPKPIRLLRIVKEFKAIPQDKASSVVIDVLDPKPDELILDLTAAPGIKTSLIMMLTENRAKVVAVDVSIKRLRIMRILMKRLGVDESRIHYVLADGRFFNSGREFDKVLLDAPCSNSGAISKDPGIKLHLTQGKLDYYSSVQRELLLKALELSRIVTYSTCSLMPEEGEYVIDYVLRASGKTIKLVRKISWASTGYPVVDFSDKLMRIYPHKHLTEAFFIARLEAS